MNTILNKIGPVVGLFIILVVIWFIVEAAAAIMMGILNAISILFWPAVVIAILWFVITSLSKDKK